MEQEFYWHIELYSGEIIKVKPDVAPSVQNMIKKQAGSITTPTRSIIIKDIKDFRLSDEIYTTQKLLADESAAAFNEPVYTKENGIKACWVKKSVPRRKWDNHYRFIPAYNMLSESEAFIVVAFKLPVHQVDPHRVQKLGRFEASQLEQRLMSRY